MESTPTSSDAGETLVELLITLVVVGIAVAAIIGALLTSIAGSAEHRYLANDDSLVKSGLEAVVQQVQNASSPQYLDCSATETPSQILTAWSPGGSNVLSFPSIPSTDVGYKVWLSGVECYNASSGLDSTCSAIVTATGSISSSLTSGCGTDGTGLMQVTVSVSDPGGYVEKLSTLVRNPIYKAADGAAIN